jgi:isocitrate dehydrogenase
MAPEEARLVLREDLGATLPAGSALGLKPMSEAGSKRLIRKVLRHALAHGRRSLTLVYKGNIMKHREGAFRNWGDELARHPPGGW